MDDPFPQREPSDLFSEPRLSEPDPFFDPPSVPPRDDGGSFIEVEPEFPYVEGDPFSGPIAPPMESQMQLPIEEEESVVTETRRRRKHARRKGLVSFLIELPVLIVVALVVAVVIKTFFVQAFFIPSGSMIPTLEIDDRVMVNKLSYTFGEPERGDVVVFESPFASSTDDLSIFESAWVAVKESLGMRPGLVPDDLIKRVMALPGETIEIHENQVFIDGVPIDEPYLPAGVVMQDFGPETIPEGMVFVMGDNRGSSHDSRKFGPIPEDHIIGRAFVLLWPFDRFGSL